MTGGGRAADKVDKDAKKIDSRHTIQVLTLAESVLWFLGLILLLPMSWGWYNPIPIKFFMAFPYAVDFASDTWVDRIIATTILGLFCWLISGVVHLVSLYKRYKRNLRRARNWWTIAAKILFVLVTLLVLVHSLAGILFLSIDASDTPL